jgi:hypothetical protein
MLWRGLSFCHGCVFYYLKEFCDISSTSASKLKFETILKGGAFKNFLKRIFCENFKNFKYPHMALK